MPNMPMKTGNLLTRGWAGYDAWDEGWLIHNDFCIVPCDGKEVMQLYGQEKVRPWPTYVVGFGKE